MKKNYYAKALALTVAASMVSVPAFAAEENDAATLQADAEKGIVTLPLLDEERPAVAAEDEAQEGDAPAEEQEETEQPAEEKVSSFTANDAEKTAIVEGEVVTSGNCGGTSKNDITDSATWKLTENGNDTYTLTISGEGAAYCDPNNLGDGNTWKDVADKISVIKVEEGITKLGSNLARLTKDVEIHLPKSLAEVTMLSDGSSTFGNNSAEIKSIVFDNGNDSYKMIDGVLFTADGKTLLRYTKEADESYIIPDGTELIASKAFNISTHLKTISIPSSVTGIWIQAFDRSGLESVTVPASVTTFGEYVFYKNVNLKSVDFQCKVLSGCDFEGCTALENVTLADGLKEIPRRAFMGCSALKSIHIPSSVEKISNSRQSDGAFSQTGLNAILINADGDIKIDSHAFSYLKGENIAVIVSAPNGTITCREIAPYSKVVSEKFSGKLNVTGTLYATNDKSTPQRQWSLLDLSEVTELTISDDAKQILWYMIDGSIAYCPNDTVYQTLFAHAGKGENHLKSNIAYVVTNGGKFASNTNFEQGILAEPEREGYKFDGWYTSAEFDESTKVEGNVITKNKSGYYPTYYAKWHKAATLTTDIGDKEFTIGKPVEFTFTTTANGDAGTMVLGTSDFSDVSVIKKLEYYETKDGNWYEFNGDFGPSTGFPMSDATSKFRVTFKKAGNYSFTASMKKADGGDVLCSTKVDLTVNKKTQAAPAVPEAENITRTSITLKAVEPANGAEAEYSIDGGKTWQDSPVFTGLFARTTYTFAVRYAETDEYAASSASETAQFTTRKKSSSSSSDTSAPTYGVNTGKTENGTISVTPAKAEAGEKVTIKATPDSGYQLDKVTAKDKNNSNVKLTKVNDNEYTFTMPSGKVSVDVTFVQKDTTDDNQNNAGEKNKVIKLQIGSRIVTVDNEAVIYDVAPVIRNDRTLVPIRIVTETLGGKVDWNGATKEVTLNIDGKEIKMTVGKTLEKYGVAPVIIDGRTFVPVRFVADELGATVAWDDATKTVTVTKIEK